MHVSHLNKTPPLDTDDHPVVLAVRPAGPPALHHLIRLLSVVALSMHLLIWFVRSTVENGISTAIVGLVYAPIFPGVLSLANEISPPEVHMVSMALMCVLPNSTMY